MGWWISNTTPNVSLPSQDSHDCLGLIEAATILMPNPSLPELRLNRRIAVLFLCKTAPSALNDGVRYQREWRREVVGALLCCLPLHTN